MREYLLYCLVHVHVAFESQLGLPPWIHPRDVKIVDYANYGIFLAKTIPR